VSSYWSFVLLVVNLFLQVWDGCATYYGLARGVEEGNPLLRHCMEYWGVGVTLVGVKSVTCVLLWWLYQIASLSLSQWGLFLTVISYFLFSFIPWWVVLFLW
jgi:hypothetical protein